MLKLYHCPQTRSSRIVWLLEELGQPYAVERIDIRAEGGAPESYRAVHPHKKVPALDHDGSVVTETIAICLYLTDAFPSAGLGFAIGEPKRGEYLSWLAYYAGVIEPNLMVKAVGAEGFSPRSAAWGSIEDMEHHLIETLRSGDYLMGERFTSADILLGSTLQFAGRLLPSDPALEAYRRRIEGRPAFARAQIKDAA